MNGYKDDIETLTRNNTFFRKVLYTAKHCQLVIMSLKPNEDIGEEIHEKEDQFFRFEQGNGKVIIDSEEMYVKDGDVVIVPAGAKHNIINTSNSENLKLYTIYAPAHHPDGTIHETKLEAEANEHN